MGRYAIKTPPQHTGWEDILEVWRAADDMDVFESAWNFDHLYPIQGDPAGPCMEAWVTLTALAQATSRLRVGCMVHAMHFRHPALTANMAATLDIVSGGRLDLGLGAGRNQPESPPYGWPELTTGERMDRFDEGVEVIVRLLSQETTDFSGTHYQLREARCEPKGPQRPHPPIMIGGQGERRTLRTVARWAQMWDALRVEPGEWVRLHEVLVGHCEAVGRDPSEITFSAHIGYSSDRDPKEAAAEAAALFDVGVDMVVFSMRPPYEVSAVERLAKVLAEQR